MNQLVEKIVGGLTELTRDRPMFVHFDSIGILYLGGKNIDRLKCFDTILNTVAERGGNLIIPAFSYSFCNKRVFSISVLSALFLFSSIIFSRVLYDFSFL